jgi:excisionase family DNA binding protein
MEQFAYSPRQAAERLGVSRSLIYDEMRAGRLRALKVGRRTVILATDIEAYLAGLPAPPRRAAV